MQCAIASAALLLLFACGEKRDPIAATIYKVVDEAEDKSARGVMKHLSASFQGASGNRAETELAIRRYFFAYTAVEMVVTDLQTQRSGPEGFATFHIDFVGLPKEIGGLDQMLPRTAGYRFEVMLREEGGDWKIAGAQWRQER